MDLEQFSLGAIHIYISYKVSYYILHTYININLCINSSMSKLDEELHESNQRIQLE